MLKRQFMRISNRGIPVVKSYRLLCLLIFCFAMPIFAEEQSDEIAALTIQQTHWTSASFKKAEKRLASVNIGMSEDGFRQIMKMQIFKSNGKAIAMTMDGEIGDVV